ncbi:MAG TPA: hypothetical protein VK395_06275, partial [Gemmataceae bacterium]|nr:hypothetical protein [Gemmataceae bacterium]
MKRQSPGDQRRKVLWLGAPADPAQAREFENRGLTIQSCTEHNAREHFPLAAGIIFRFDKEQPTVFESQLRNLAAQAVNHGLFVLSLANTDETFLVMDRALKSLRLEFETANKVLSPEIAELIARHDPGPGEKDVEITGVRIPDQTRLFLRRAFHDCKSIAIASLTEGRSAAGRTHQTFSRFRAPAKVSSRKPVSKAAALRFRAMLVLAGFRLSRLN